MELFGDINDVDIPRDSHSGIIMKTKLKSLYYTCDVNILVDEYPASRDDVQKQDMYSSLVQWFDDFKSEECKELRDVLQGLIFTVNIDTQSADEVAKTLRLVSEIRELFQDNFFCLVLGVSSERRDVLEIEDIAIENALEFVYFNESGENEFKDKIGKDRIKELLYSHEWESLDIDEDTYKQGKVERAEEMTTGLLDDEKVDLTHVLDKLRSAKLTAADLDGEEKADYVNKVIEEMIDYI